MDQSIRWVMLAAALLSLAGCGGGWRDASRESAGLAPPVSEQQAVVQAYAARVWGWRGWLADHTWIATKAEGADSYVVYEVIGWHLRRGGSALRIAEDVPDRYWFGSKPTLLLDKRGAAAAALIGNIAAAARRYPYQQTYRAYPGPNSNTFTAWVAAEVPALELQLPFRALGKNYPFERGGEQLTADS